MDIGSALLLLIPFAIIALWIVDEVYEELLIIVATERAVAISDIFNTVLI
jgi:hypothetical protein